MEEMETIRKNLEAVRTAAKRAAESSPYGQSYELLLATKYATAEQINFCHAQGVRLIGENRVQSLLEKYDALDKDGLEIHFIGTLQKNKVRYIIDKVDMIESLDSLPLAAEIEKQAAKIGKTVDCLVEINIGDEANKGGIGKTEVAGFVDALAAFPHIRVCGLMTMAPKCAEKSDYRKFFAESYQIFIDICKEKLHNIGRCTLSMGMSDSFEEALTEGATLVRIGRAIFSENK